MSHIDSFLMPTRITTNDTNNIPRNDTIIRNDIANQNEVSERQEKFSDIENNSASNQPRILTDSELSPEVCTQPSEDVDKLSLKNTSKYDTSDSSLARDTSEHVIGHASLNFSLNPQDTSFFSPEHPQDIRISPEVESPSEPNPPPESSQLDSGVAEDRIELFTAGMDEELANSDNSKLEIKLQAKNDMELQVNNSYDVLINKEHSNNNDDTDTVKDSQKSNSTSLKEISNIPVSTTTTNSISKRKRDHSKSPRSRDERRIRSSSREHAKRLSRNLKRSLQEKNYEKDSKHITNHDDEDDGNRSKNYSRLVKQHHTQRDLREILTRNAANNTSRDNSDVGRRTFYRITSSRFSDKELSDRHKRMRQQINRSLIAGASHVQQDIDPEKEWQEQNKLREQTRIEVERARKELETHRKPDSNLAMKSTPQFNHKTSNSTSSYFGTRSLTQSNDVLNSVDYLEAPVPPIRTVEPSQKPSTRILHVKNLVRPFTIHQLRGMLELYGTLINIQDYNTTYLWTDRTKSQCCAIYTNTLAAEKSRTALYGAKWPLVNKKELTVEFLTISEFNEISSLNLTQDILDQTYNEDPIPERVENEPKVNKQVSNSEQNKVAKLQTEKDSQHRMKTIKIKIATRRTSIKTAIQNDIKDKISHEQSTLHPLTPFKDAREKIIKVSKNQIEAPIKNRTPKKKENDFQKLPSKTKQLPILNFKPEVPVKIIPPQKEIKVGEKRPTDKIHRKVTPQKEILPKKRKEEPPQKPKEQEQKHEKKSEIPQSDAESESFECSGQAALLDTLFRKTKTEPCIYWLPLTEAQIKLKEKLRLRTNSHKKPDIIRQVKRNVQTSRDKNRKSSSGNKYSRSPRNHRRK